MSARPTRHTQASWADFADACPALAARVQERFGHHRHAVMATIRSDGSPRLSGMETPIRDGHLWLGMEHTSAKAADLRRDPRVGLHCAPDDEDLAKGDARIEGSVVPADPEQLEVFLRGHRHEVEDEIRLALFTVDIARAVLVQVADKHLVIQTWTPSSGLTERRSH